VFTEGTQISGRPSEDSVLLLVRLSGDDPLLGLGEARALCEARTGVADVVESSPPVGLLRCGGEVDLGALCGFVPESGPLVWRGSVDEFDPRGLVAGPLAIDGPAKADAEGFGRSSPEVARELGELLIRAGVPIDVRRPRSILKALRVGDSVYVAVIRPHRGKWRSRDLRLRPFRHPSMLEPRLARALVNLSRPVVGGVLLDPFSGTGGVLLEGEVVGCLPVGVDLDWRMARGALRNVSWAGSIGGIIRGDARALPVGRADCAASDLPYGRMSSSHGSSTEELLSSVVGQLPRILRTGGYAALMVRERVRPASAEGVELLETYLHRVHDALTRKILVYRVTGADDRADVPGHGLRVPGPRQEAAVGGPQAR
jgi:tRNA (guanine10-N2)-dimethyltransferase